MRRGERYSLFLRNVCDVNTQCINNITERLIDRFELHPPIDIAPVVKEYADVSSMVLPDELDGIVAFLKHPTLRARIILNSTKPTTRKRFTLAHELGHVVIPWHIGSIGSHTDTFEDSSDFIYREMEREANAFASSILIPHRWTASILTKPDDVCDLISNAYSRLRISRTALCITLMQRLPAGWRYIEVDPTGSVLYHSQSEDSRFSFINRGDNINILELSTPGSVVTEIQNSSNRIFIVHHTPSNIEINTEMMDWREVLSEILDEVIPDPEEKRKTVCKINGIIGSEMGRRKPESVLELTSRLEQRFSFRRDLPIKLLTHPQLRTFLMLKAQDYFSRRSP